MKAKSEMSDSWENEGGSVHDKILIDYDIYLADQTKLFEIRKIAEGWKNMNGAHRAYGETILRILDEKL